MYEIRDCSLQGYSQAVQDAVMNWNYTKLCSEKVLLVFGERILSSLAFVLLMQNTQQLVPPIVISGTALKFNK